MRGNCRVRFVASLGQISCIRMRGEKVLRTITYTKEGVHPDPQHLRKSEVAEWNEAVKAAGWK